MTLCARVNFTVEMDEGVNPQLFLHLKPERTFGTLEVLSISLVIGMNRFLVRVSSG